MGDSTLLHLPILRAGRPYRSLDVELLRDVRSGEPVAEMSLAHPGLVARDLLQAAENRRKLEAVPYRELLAVCRRAGELFAQGTLRIDPAGEPCQSPEDYLQQLASTTGMPVALGRLNLQKIRSVLENIEAVLDGLTRGVDLALLDRGWGEDRGRRLSYLRLADSLGAILPNNSPGVHNLWLPAIPLKTPVVLKPGSSEPWTPLRLANAFLEAGCPPEAFSFYPARHAASTEILMKTGRALFFGDAATVASWRGSGKVQVHGPGWSKVILGADAAPSWRDHLELIATSVAANGGRSCINASGVWLPSHGAELAHALAAKLAAIPARALGDPAAALAAFPDPEVAAGISRHIDEQLKIPGARDLTAELRSGGRIALADGCTFLLPTVVHLDDPEHPLASTELLFPFVAVVDCPQEQLLEAIGPTLIGTVITEDAEFRRQALECRHIDRLNLGAVPTPAISWDQPHEGNLFDLLYQQRALQLAS